MKDDHVLSKALLSCPYALFVIHRKNCSVLDVSTKFASFLGVDPRFWIGRHLAGISLWADPSDGEYLADRVIQARGVTLWTAEFSRLNNPPTPFVLTTTPVNLAGCRDWVLVSGRENSENLKIESSLKHSESLYREAQHIAHIGHWELDLRKDRLIWSDEIFRIFDINPNSFSASYDTFLSMIHPEDRDFVDQTYKQSLMEKIPYDVIHRLLMKDGKVKYVHEQGQSQWDNQGNPVRSFGTVQDITALKEAELARNHLERQLRQSQKLEAIGTLASGIAHDFNNILFAILGYTEMTMDLTEPESLLHQNLEKVQEAGNRAKELVAQILTFCRKKSENKAPVQIKLIVKEVLTMIRATLPSSIDIYDHLYSSSLMSANTGQIHQVIMNLCTNAAFAMRNSDTGVLSVELEDIYMDEAFAKQFVNAAPGPYVKLVIGDTGEGMTDEVKERIFEPFFTTKGEGEGSGLGLSMVHGIVKNHDGHILVYSETGIGTTIKIFFPVIDAPALEAHGEAIPLPTGAEHVLVVDDEPMIASVVTNMLQSLGYTVDFFGDSLKALGVFESAPDRYDLVISDMTMPGMNGLRLAEKIMAVKPAIPVIITTGFSEKISELAIRDTGITHLLLKPIGKRNLAMAVRQSLDQHHHEPETQM